MVFRVGIITVSRDKIVVLFDERSESEVIMSNLRGCRPEVEAAAI